MSSLLISAVQLQELLTQSQNQVLVFDVRSNLANAQAGRQAYLGGHIPGAYFLDINTDLSGIAGNDTGRHPLPSPDDFAALMARHGLTPETWVVVYDEANSFFAARLWWMLRWLGHKRVLVLNGGWRAWLAAGGATETSENRGVAHSSVPAGTGAGAMPTVNMDDLRANLREPRLAVVDARAAERFRGDQETIDPVAGHIPGALNRHCALNLQSDGLFKPAEQLRAEFQALMPNQTADHVVHQCGSGVTACHNLFAMELAGLTGSVLYPGSWSQWCRDPSNPVARGSE